ncbi:MAG: putative metal-binding motif-containing protein [Pseudomonadota bacterium]|nr:putative metal-binding motif-containing protein [Pseudomonadota bacterium]
MRPVPLLLLLVACQDNKVSVYNTPPAVSVLSPADGAGVDPGTLVEFYGGANDAQDDANELAISWESTLDGVLGADPPDGDGNVYLATDLLSSGDHVITLTAVDTDAESASTSITLSVAPGFDGEGAPTVVLLGPTTGQLFGPSEAVNLVAAVTDGEDAFDTLMVEVIDVRDGSVWTGSPSATGSLSVPLTLTPGPHALTVNAVDSDGNTGTASVAFEILADGRPTVAITEPTDGAGFDLATLVSFRGIVADDETPVDVLGIAWSSDVVGVFATNAADSSGASSTSYALPTGIHTITLSATDALGLTGSDAVVITVTDPLDRDDDGDGYTENAGDCDDGDPRTNPGASDLCDAADNDCSGYVNDPDWDTYERNESISTPYDLGEVDSSFGWSNSSLTLSGLTISDEADEDWFAWNADDEVWDNIAITVTASGLTARGEYVLELYDGDGNVVDSDAGTSSLSVSFSGDVFDTDEDDWSVRVYATTWPSSSCSSTFSLTIRS